MSSARILCRQPVESIADCSECVCVRPSASTRVYRSAFPETENHKSNDDHKLLYLTTEASAHRIHEGMFGPDNLIFYCRFPLCCLCLSRARALAVYTQFSNSLCINFFHKMPIGYGQTMELRSRKSRFEFTKAHLFSNKTNIGHFMIYNAEFKIAKDERRRSLRRKCWTRVEKRYVLRSRIWCDLEIFFFPLCRQRFAYINLNWRLERAEGRMGTRRTIAE